MEAALRHGRLVVMINFAIILTLVLLGALYDFAGLLNGYFDLDGERNVPTAYSALILAAAVLLALAVGLTEERGTQFRYACLGIAAFFAFIALEEIYYVHERVELELGIPWPILYVPISALGGLAWLGVLRRFRTSPRLLAYWLAGGAAWGLVQVLELLGHKYPPDSGTVVSKTLIIAEESLEMLGASLFVIALALAFGAAIAPAKTRLRRIPPSARQLELPGQASERSVSETLS